VPTQVEVWRWEEDKRESTVLAKYYDYLTVPELFTILYKELMKMVLNPGRASPRRTTLAKCSYGAISLIQCRQTGAPYMCLKSH
jgi:hypothetical protein